MSDAWWALQEPVVVLTDENRHNGIKAEYLGVYRPVGMHEGAFHYENESGSHLYYSSESDAWVVLSEFAPTENVADIYIAGDKQVNGLVGRKQWKCSHNTFARQPGSGFRTHHITVKLARVN